jgi:hypothetical protein
MGEEEDEVKEESFQHERVLVIRSVFLVFMLSANFSGFLVDF